jgi:GMP synthase (glutamine-hydrolysing)
LKSIAIIKTGATFDSTRDKYGDFGEWVRNFISGNVDVKIYDIATNHQLPPIEDTMGAIITGSHSMVTDNLAWSLKLEEWVKEAKDKNIPILGICYGHQLIAKALGADVDYNPQGKEIGCVEIKTSEEIKKDYLFNDAPDIFMAHVTHSQSVIKLPEGSISMGYNTFDANHIVKYAKYVWGVQFHPEFDENIMVEYIKNQEKTLENYDLGILYSEVTNTPYANSIINNFAKLAQELE